MGFEERQKLLVVWTVAVHGGWFVGDGWCDGSLHGDLPVYVLPNVYIL